MRLAEFIEVEPVLMRVFLEERFRKRDRYVVRQGSEIFVADHDPNLVVAPHIELLAEQTRKNSNSRLDISPSSEVRRLSGEHGFLVGADGGEFCGWLCEYDLDGNLVAEHSSQSSELDLRESSEKFAYEPENVLGMHRFGSKVIVFRGLNHGFTSGRAEIYEGEIGRGLKLIRKIDLGTAPYANGIHSDKRLLVVNQYEISEIDATTRAIAPIRVRPQQQLYAEKFGFTDEVDLRHTGKQHFRLVARQAGMSFYRSRNILGDGHAIYLGGRGVVTKLVPANGEYVAKWLVHPNDVSLVEEVRRLTISGENYDQLAMRYGAQ